MGTRPAVARAIGTLPTGTARLGGWWRRVTPVVGQARAEVAPRVAAGLEQARAEVAPRVAAGLEQARAELAPRVSATADRLRNELVPRVAEAVEEALASATPVAAEAGARGRAALAALRGEEPPRRRHTGRWLAFAAVVGVGVAAVVVYRRNSRPMWEEAEPVAVELSPPGEADDAEPQTDRGTEEADNPVDASGSEQGDGGSTPNGQVQGTEPEPSAASGPNGTAPHSS